MFWHLRVLSFYAVVIIVTILFSIVVCLPLMFLNLTYHTKYTIAVVFSHVFIWLAKNICGLNYKVEGLKKLPKEPCIVMSNHQSFWENVFMQLIIPEHSWIIKRELLNIPFWGWGLRTLDPVALNRSDAYSVRQILEKGVKKIESGLWLVVFPEATRLRPDRSVKFKPSAAKLAIAAEVTVVLIAHNAGVYWPSGLWIKKPGTITVKIIDVLSKDVIAGYDARGLTDYIEKIINEEKHKLFESSEKN